MRMLHLYICLLPNVFRYLEILKEIKVGVVNHHVVNESAKNYGHFIELMIRIGITFATLSYFVISPRT